MINSRKRFAEEVMISSPAEEVWNYLCKVEDWPKWDTELKSAKSIGQFQLGGKGVMKPSKGPQLNFIVIAFKEGKSYCVRTKMPFGYLDMQRTVLNAGTQSIFRDEISFGGSGGSIFALFLGGKFKKVLPEVMQKFKRQVEQLSKTP